jgi:spermidine synthase
MTSIEISEERGVRYLHFGSPWVQGAMRIARPWALELEYTREMMMPLVLRADPAWPASVLQIGLGSASLTKFLHRHRPDARLTVVEIAPDVVAAARQFFKLPDESPRLRIEIADGHDYMAAARRRFELIVVDAFDAKGRSGMLDSIPFYLNCRARLADGGLVAVNLLDRRKGAQASLERLRIAFDDRVLVLPPCEAGNTVAIAASGAPMRESFDELRASAASLKERTGLNLLPMLARLAQARRAAMLIL